MSFLSRFRVPTKILAIVLLISGIAAGRSPSTIHNTFRIFAPADDEHDCSPQG